LKAALDLLTERGIERTSMDAIAESSGVSKATIYKHWKDKETLLLEVMAYLNGLNERPRLDSGDTRKDLITVLAHKAPDDRARLQERLMPHLIAYSAYNQTFGQTWREMAMEPPRRELRSLLTRGIQKGELPRNLNFELAMTLLLGPLLYVHIFQKQHRTVNRSALAQDVVDAFWRAFSLHEIDSTVAQGSLGDKPARPAVVHVRQY
jgi:AcrR family transcriptional regulator